jgi:hypothetical protein
MTRRTRFAILFLSFFLGRYAAHAGPSQREQQLFDLVNRERQKAGLNKLEWSDELAEAALAHSKLLADHQDLSHQFPGEPLLQESAPPNYASMPWQKMLRKRLTWIPPTLR